MSETVARLRDWGEPAHPAVIRLYDDLIQVYRVMRQNQEKIDAAFDRVAAQIGFVVTTTLPVRVEIAEEGAVKKTQFDGEALRGTIFEKELSGFLQDLTCKPFTGVPPGTYRFYLIWYNALKLKLCRDWFEPAHVIQGLLGSFASQSGGGVAQAFVRPEVREPAHWFDPGVAIAIEDAVVISAIDEVYPDLRLSERITADRLAIRQIGPGVKEPAHPPYFFGSAERDVLSEVRAILGKQRT
jgi:hypothetical protein